MAYIIADNILSPLGKTTAENLQAILAGRTALTPHAAAELGVGEDFVSSRLDELLGELQFSHFERKVVASVKSSLEGVNIDVRSSHTLLILSTTKGNIEALTLQSSADEVAVGHTAQRIARHLGFTTAPIVVCNACISGLSALILAQRLIDQGAYRDVIVCGSDDIGRFVVSGFQSLKALSAQACRPFDIERTGLNLGEAVATAVLSAEPSESCWRLVEGVVRNDAYHISAPSKTAEGQYRCLEQLLSHHSNFPIDFINLHGTATLFNDQMESVAVERAGLSAVSANGYKGYYGHTLGAAGVLETVLSIHAAEAHTIVGTRGYEELGVSGRVSVSADQRRCQSRSFLKTLSGFGGCNAAALFAHVGEADVKNSVSQETPRSLVATHHLRLTPVSIEIDGEELPLMGHNGYKSLTTLYKAHIDDYPKFYKMDPLSRLGFVASELLLQAERGGAIPHSGDDTSRAIIFFNEHSSLAADRKYLESIATEGQYFPSPSEFVYTLPNIVTGEIAIRNGYRGETSFYILPSRNERLEQGILSSATSDPATRSILAGWLDYRDDQNFLADLSIYNVIDILAKE